MPSTMTGPQHVERHRDGSVRATGPLHDGQPHGHWECFRLDGTKLRSGFFDNGVPVGQWTTYDKAGQVHKMMSQD